VLRIDIASLRRRDAIITKGAKLQPNSDEIEPTMMRAASRP
jgi:hypothetical protein